ncbi:MAG TPA: hypothetical protein VN934_04120 [Candidatus Tumulicola sp.]|nr:hypothetical protein [Candidatus Tumulicola sp.]
MALGERILETIGAHELGAARTFHLDRLADAIFEHHWHLSDLSWSSLPLLPIPQRAKGRRLQAFVEFGKRAIRVQLAGERVAVAAANILLAFAQASGLAGAAQRAIAGVLNDEASHTAVMTELAARADSEYANVDISAPGESPLFSAFLAEMPELHPALVAMFMGAYEAMVAIRSYNEEAGYEMPSVLGEIAERMGKDDGRHAKVMRLVAQELVELFRAQGALSSANGESVRHALLDPTRRFWPLLIQHEWLLIHDDPRLAREFQRRADEDAVVGRRFFSACGLQPEELDYVDLETLTSDTAARCVNNAALNSSGLSTIGE